MGRAGAAAEHRRQPRVQRVLDLLWADEVDVAVKASGGEDAPLTGNGLRAGTHDDIHAGLGVGVPRFADAGDAPVLETDIGLEDAGVVHDQRVRDDRIHGPLGPRRLRLTHSVPDHLATAELDLFTVNRGVFAGATRLCPTHRFGGQVAFDLNDEVRISEPHLVPGGGAEHGGVVGAFDGGGHDLSHFLPRVFMSMDSVLIRRRVAGSGGRALTKFGVRPSLDSSRPKRAIEGEKACRALHVA